MQRTRSAWAIATLTLAATLVAQSAWVPVVARAVVQSATVSGMVTDKASGTPISGAYVQIYYETPTSSWIQVPGVYTAADGSYTTTLTPSWPFPRNCTLIFTDPSRAGSLSLAHRSCWWSDVDAQHASLVSLGSQAASMATHFTLNDGDALTGYDAHMKHYFVKMSGKVVDRAGSPISGIFVAPYTKNFASWSAPVNGNANKTDALGRFTIWANPWLESGCYQTILANSGWSGTKYYDGRWYKNALQKPPLTLGLAQQAMWSSVYKFRMKSGETTSGLVIRMTRDVADVVSITKTWRTTGRVGHVQGTLTPVHDPVIPIRVQFYKYSSSKHKYLAYGEPLTATASNSGNVTYWSAKRTLVKGKFGVRAYVGTHLWKYHRAYKTGLTTFTVS